MRLLGLAVLGRPGLGLSQGVKAVAQRVHQIDDGAGVARLQGCMRVA